MPPDVVFIGDVDCPPALRRALPPQVSFVEISGLDLEEHDPPFIMTYRALSTSLDQGYNILEQPSEGQFLLLVPPLSGDEKHTVALPSGETFRIRLESGSTVSISREVIKDAALRTYDVDTAGYFAEFVGRERGTDSSGRPVLVEFQAKSTGGGLICTTIGFDKIAVSGSERNRIDLLETLVTYLKDRHEQVINGPPENKSTSSTENEDGSSLRPELFDAGLLTVYHYHVSPNASELNIQSVSKALPANLDPGFSKAEWKQFEREATQTGILTESSVNSSQLGEYIDRRGLRSFARRITND